MAVILEERGRGKFKPAPDYEVDEVKELLNKKIEEERQAFADCSEEIEFDKLNYDPNKWNLLSLFSGCGGLDLGFELAGLKAVMGEEVMEAAFADKKVFDENINNNVFNTIYVNDIFDEARETYAQNAGKYIYMDKSDIRKIKEFPKADIVLGGFPCPGFSEAGPRLVDDKRNFLYLHFIRCLMQSNPKIFVAENVKGMMTLGKGEVFKQIVQDFAAAGYTVYHKLLNSAEYGVPQIRERVILVGVRNDIDFEYVHPEPTHGYGIDGLKEVVTLRDAIGDLEDDPGDYYTGSYSTIFMSRNRKKLWSQPSFTIQASGRQAPIHPAGAPMEHVGKDRYIFSDGEKKNRRLSVKEIARIQTFPDWYELSRGSRKRNKNAQLDLVYKQIGNAVPVRLALVIAEPIARFAKEELEKREGKENISIIEDTVEKKGKWNKTLCKENTMSIQLYDFEKEFFKKKDDGESVLSDKEINEKYELGEARIVTEQGAIKLPLVPDVFKGDKYNRKPIYQRRITWDIKKRSRLIESFIMNIPVPPIFMYEIEYGKYEVMDGLQRISAIIDFYNDVYALEDLTEWSELNGKKYSELPQKVKEGIDRRQISMVSLLKESAKTAAQEQKMKRMVFERLNTGGVKLEEQEIRNALYDGAFNEMCKKLAEMDEFRALWGIPKNIKGNNSVNELEELDVVDSLDVAEELASNHLYMRMYDVELVLRFFAMRHIDEYSGQLCDFLDTCLISGNKMISDDNNRKSLFENLFRETICKAKKVFGEIAFCQFKQYRDKYKWSKPQKMIYDALMLALSEYEISDNIEFDHNKNKKYLEDFYIKNVNWFNGKKQSKNDIMERKNLFDKALKDIIEG